MQPLPERERHRFEPILARLARESQERFGVRPVALSVVGYEERPFSWICRSSVRSAGASDRYVFIKIFKPKAPGSGVDLRARVVQDFAITSDIHAFMTSWPDLGVVRPIACYDDVLTLVTEEAAGVTLLDELQAHATWFPRRAALDRLVAASEGVGRWLKHFQGFRPGGALSADALREYVDVRLRRLVDHRVMAAVERERLLSHLTSLGRQLTPHDLREVSIHADLAPANILVSETRVVILDFAMAGRGTVLHDISRLHMQLDLLRAKPHFRRATIAALQAALLRGFDSALSPDLPLFRLLSMLHHVNHFGTLALRRESLAARLVSARAIAIHRRWIRRELDAGAA